MARKRTIAAGLIAGIVIGHVLTLFMMVNSMRDRPSEWVEFIRGDLMHNDEDSGKEIEL